MSRKYLGADFKRDGLISHRQNVDNDSADVTSAGKY